jgi:hypothetical protein
MMLAWLAVVFAGILGNGAPEASRISKEIQSAVAQTVELTPIKLPVKQLGTLTRHGTGSRDIVANLHVDGLVGGELIDKGGTLSLRLVVYSADGGLRSLSEITLRRRALSLDDFAAIRSNLADELAALAPPKSKAKPAVAPKPEPEPEIEMEPAPAAAPAPTEVAAADEPAAAAADEESPIDMHRPEDDAPVGVVASADEDPDPVLGLKVGAGLGLMARSFAPGPSTVTGYSASPVAAFSIAMQVQPARRLCLDALVDRTITMATPMGSDMASTTMSRWEVSADYFVTHGRFAIAGRFGLGRRAFAIDSQLSSRTPDSDYDYVILGATASAAIGSRVVVHALAAFEPVFSGSEPTEMAFGEARRWAVDVGGAVELRVRDHVYARVAADLQRFAWSWPSAGERGAGGAVDLFPSAMASMGAVY